MQLCSSYGYGVPGRCVVGAACVVVKSGSSVRFEGTVVFVGGQLGTPVVQGMADVAFVSGQSGVV